MSEDRLYPSRPFLAASVAVIRDGKVLVATRTKPPAPAVFSLPGGVVESGETLAEAALRELHEEVGVTAEMIGFVDHVEVIGRDAEGRARHHFVVCAHVAQWRAGEGQAGPEAGETRWVDLAELATLPTTPGLVAIVEKALSRAAER